MKWRLLACWSVLLLSLPAVAQQSNMNRWLNAGSAEQRTEKLVSLGIKPEEARSAAEDAVQWRLVRREPRPQLAVLFVPCGAFDGAALYLLTTADDRWHVTDRTGFDCHYDESLSFETTPLRRADVDDVLVHHECEERGTGFVQQNFNVYAVDSSKFKRILDSEETVRDMGTAGGKYDLLQRSFFATVPTSESTARAIEETRCSNLNGKLTIQTRTFRWSAAAFRFVPSKFAKVDATDEKSKAACR
jgi:hypothetical protein